MRTFGYRCGGGLDLLVLVLVLVFSVVPRLVSLLMFRAIAFIDNIAIPSPSQRVLSLQQ